ncbi:hypothetical protein LTR37_015427 [Vermiconidia calcicola]|uniref:Uncharacterized protein n=1 Tax=Vermiconidia calcicola TaxID=1690605 RepID=A0ACC3MRN0_9PEZI|nr:hypothetical protein LTR37_015427 [Vermiconidia calcicola]
MRSAIIAAAFAATAMAVPYEKRNVVTNTEFDVVYVTDVVTVTNGGAKVAAAPTEQAQNPGHNYGGGHWGHGHGHGKPHGGAPPAEYTTKQTVKPKPTKKSTKKPTQKPTQAPEPEPTPSATGGWGNPTASEAPEETSKPPSGPPPSDYAGKVVLHHNLHRSNHSAPDVAWDDKLASIAATIASSCRYEHNTDAGGGGYGQNIAAGVAADNVTAIITNLFYNSEVSAYESYYGMAQPPMDNFHVWGHFSQIVWKSTTSVGCATHDCAGTGLANVGADVPPVFTVCNYKSAGNFANEYDVNVLAPKGRPTAEWDTGL